MIKFRLRFLLAAMLIVLGLAVSNATDSNGVKVGGLYYNLVGTRAYVVNEPGYFEDYRNYSALAEHHVVIPEKITYEGEDYIVDAIAGMAFRGCKMFSITIPKTVKDIGFEAFEGAGKDFCVSISDLTSWCNLIDRGSSFGPHKLCIGNSEITSLIIPDDLEQVRNYAFQGCSGITSVTIPNSVTTIGWEAFDGCSGLQTVKIGDAVTTIKDGAFKGCANIENVYVNDLTTWLNIDFEYDEESGANPLEYAKNFYVGRKEITSIEIPNNIKNVPSNVFKSFKGLKSVVIGDSVKTIGASFTRCTGLKSVSLGKSLKNIYNKAFYGSDSIQVIECHNPIPPQCSEDAFSSSIFSTCVLRVPNGTIDAYRAAGIWCDFVNIEAMPAYAGIDDIDANNRVEVARYDVNGREVDADYRGVVIVRYNDGSVEKMVNK